MVCMNNKAHVCNQDRSQTIDIEAEIWSSSAPCGKNLVRQCVPSSVFYWDDDECVAQMQCMRDGQSQIGHLKQWALISGNSSKNGTHGRHFPLLWCLFFSPPVLP